ncbi:MAG: sensor histidine kinase [Anaerolineae bacterium]
MENPLPEVTTLLNLLIVRRGIAFASLDRNGCIQVASPNLGDFVEEGRRPLPGTPLTDLFIEFWGMDTFLQALLRGEEKEFRVAPVVGERADGYRYLSFEIFHIQDESSPALLVVEDITRLGEQEQRIIQERNEVRLLSAELQRANAELRRLNDFKSTILSMAAHDLRTPLTALSVRLDLLMEDLQTGQETIPHLETLRWMRHSVGRMNYLLSGLLDREQAERGVLRLSLAPCDLVKVLQRVVSMAPPDATGRVELKTPGKLEIVADDRCLQQVFFNLMENALKYTPADQKVTIALRRSGEEAVVEVSDRGKGMTPEEAARLFQMFYRTEEARTSPIPGTGLGLFIVKTLVEAHQGRVEVDSRPSQGTTFRVYLPLRPDQK